MKTIQTWLQSIVVAVARAVAKQRRHAAITTRGASELTDEIRRYDIEDLILS
jgi:hypothetical protein